MDRQQIEQRWREIDRALADIVEGKVTHGADPATREGELLEEQDALEYELGLAYLEERKRARKR